MKLVQFTCNERLGFGVLTDEGVRDVGSALGITELAVALAEHDGMDKIAAATASSELLASSQVVLRRPITRPDKVYCVGLNYRAHVAETGRDMPAYPTLFTRYHDSFVDPGAPLICPSESQHFDYEGELALVIGRHADRVSEDDALNIVAGVTCLNDGSIRDFQKHTTQFTPGKNFRSSGSFGPAIVTLDECGPIEALQLTTRLNGEVVQEAPLSDLIFTVPQLISYITTFSPLRPGDVIATGTPGGVGMARKPPLWLTEGDTIEVSIPRVGKLSNTVARQTGV